MRRARDYLEGHEEQSSSSRQHSTPHGYDEFSSPRTTSYGGNSSQNTTLSSGPTHPPPQSPMQVAQSASSIILPSPASLKFPSSQSLPPMSPPTTSQTSIQNADLQDLQHQVSVKTFEFQTLQREYDALLQNLERQKTKCATFEKKLEVSGIEINSLKEEKERLLAQILTVEGQIEELQQSRDEARRQLVANGAQYVRIMDMANRLQSQSAEAKKIWELEKARLEQRIRLLEEAMVAGTPKPTPTVVAEQQPGINSVPSSVDSTDTMNTTIPSQTEIINVLRSEISRLRSRTHTLESTVQNMRRESFSIQTVARKILDSGDKIGNIAKEVVGEDE
ncbi:hypothetical protein AA0117_g2350 [Alternaria alternata]|uniref:Uncharacterized protein n=1 Tax=Alternaria alternata TaxID=5599 RepID=A0A4Q4NS91_ALTAL|nr:hypothetical protein AA0117_g2350 [Alternaria alternata]